jgi:rhodanese-related sulfurtransferase
MKSPVTYARRANALAATCRIARPELPWISPSEFLERSQEEPWTIVDVRTPEERSVSLIPGAISTEEFEGHLDEHVGRSVLVYCTAGCRSGAYARELRQRGLKAFNLHGGVLAWALNEGSFVTPEGEPTRRVHVHGEPWDVLPPEYEAVR